MSIRLTLLAPTVLTLSSLAATCHAQTVQLGSNLEPVDVPEYRAPVLPILPHGASRLSLGPQPSPLGRLRCWQHGVAVLDEPLADATLAAGTSTLTVLGGDGRQSAVVNAGTGMCLVTMGRIKPLSPPGSCCRVVGPRTMFESSVRPEE